MTGLFPSTTYYAAVKARDGAGNLSPISGTVTGTTTAGTVVFADDMEGGVVNEWTTNGGTGLWHQSTHKSLSPNTAWYYGIEGAWDYDTGATNSGTLASPAIDLTGAKKKA